MALETRAHDAQNIAAKQRDPLVQLLQQLCAEQRAADGKGEVCENHLRGGTAAGRLGDVPTTHGELSSRSRRRRSTSSSSSSERSTTSSDYLGLASIGIGELDRLAELGDKDCVRDELAGWVTDSVVRVAALDVGHTGRVAVHGTGFAEIGGQFVPQEALSVDFEVLGDEEFAEAEEGDAVCEGEVVFVFQSWRGRRDGKKVSHDSLCTGRVFGKTFEIRRLILVNSILLVIWDIWATLGLTVRVAKLEHTAHFEVSELVVNIDAVFVQSLLSVRLSQICWEVKDTYANRAAETGPQIVGSKANDSLREKKSV